MGSSAVVRAYAKGRESSPMAYIKTTWDERFYAQSLPDGLVDAVSGFGDGVYTVITLGMGDLELIREVLYNGGGTVNMDSPNYFWANITGKGYAMFLPLAPKGYVLGSPTVQVAHWAPASAPVGANTVLQANQWVMIGSNANVINYVMSGVGVRNVSLSRKFPFLKGQSYPFRNSFVQEVQHSQLQWPKGWEAWKGLVGQRRYKP